MVVVQLLVELVVVLLLPSPENTRPARSRRLCYDPHCSCSCPDPCYPGPHGCGAPRRHAGLVCVHVSGSVCVCR